MRTAEKLETPRVLNQAPRVRTLPPWVRRLMLLVHVLVSVGGLGLYLALLTLAVAGLTTKDAEQRRAAYLAMGFLSDSLIIPMNLGVLITGSMLGIGTHWGLFRYYWVTAKLGFSLLLGTASIFGLRARIAESIGNVMAAPPDAGSIGTFLVLVLPIAAAIYVINTFLVIYKPWVTISPGY